MSPRWSTDVPTDPRGTAYPLKRTPPGGKLVAAVTSEDLLGCDTHFFGGHTVPCERPDCEACSKGMPFRWKGYLSALDNRTALHFIFEFTLQAAEPFKQYRLAHGSLRGCRFEATRLHNKVNGRVIISCRPVDMLKVTLPKTPDIAACMAIIWNLPAGQIETNRQMLGHPAMTNTHKTLSEFNPNPDPKKNKTP